MSFDPITAGIDLVSKLIDRVIPDRTQADAAKAELLKMQLQGELNQLTAQTDINKIEAASTNWFVAGWRPCSGWICNIGLLYTFVLQPVAQWAATSFGIPTPPTINAETLTVLLGALLGVGTLRSYDKKNGTS